MLRFTRRVVEQQARQQLAQIDGWIAAEETRVAELRRQQETVERVAPDWVLQGMINSQSVMAHTGDCWASKGKRTKAASRDEVIDALTHGAEACSLCRPDTVLGLLD